MNINDQRKPGRPLGVSLAIIASVLLFTCWPLVQIISILRLNTLMDSQGGITTGVSLTNVPEFTFFIQVLFSFIFFFIAVLAWRGRPAKMRHVLVGAVLLFTAISIIFNILPSLLYQPSLNNGGLDSGQEIDRTLTTAKLVYTILLPLYVVWFLNRGPSRAFYRGYYLKDPADEASVQQKEPESET